MSGLFRSQKWQLKSCPYTSHNAHISTSYTYKHHTNQTPNINTLPPLHKNNSSTSISSLCSTHTIPHTYIKTTLTHSPHYHHTHQPQTNHTHKPQTNYTQTTHPASTISHTIHSQTYFNTQQPGPQPHTLTLQPTTRHLHQHTQTGTGPPDTTTSKTLLQTHSSHTPQTNNRYSTTYTHFSHRHEQTST